jgi:two-component system CheB/CheR fusion protein
MMRARHDEPGEGAEEAAQGDVDPLLDYIRRSRRFDFSGYKRTSLERRIQKRMDDVGCSTFSDYQDYLEVHPDEFESFFNTILINVTSFFRDAAAWELLTDEIIPRIVSGKQPEDPIRVWSAGCATGEEAYSLAMSLCDSLGSDQFRNRVKIYGTDADELALTKARQASYSRKELQGVPEPYIERYFEKANGDGPHVFRGDLRRSVIFGRHDLVQDAPISRLDLLVCRNTLMYFNAETQNKILERFNFALADGGYLFLGKAETLVRQSTLFTPVDLRLRIFAKTTDPMRPRSVNGLFHRDLAPDPAPGPLRGVALDAVPVPLIVVDEANTVVEITTAARSIFGLRSKDVGTPLQNLEISYRPLELRSLLADAISERRSVERKGVRWSDNDDRRIFDVAALPLVGEDGAAVGAIISFNDVSRYHRLQEELEQSNRDLEAAYEELQSTNEELETTNEELQSTIEELETTNEELQSSNEELETTNEELQSTNEELHTLNARLDHRSGDLDRANLHLQGILTGLRLGVVVLDGDLNVQLWNRWAEDLWGLRTDEVGGRSFANLDIGLPVERLLVSIRRCLDGTITHEENTVPARNRRGQSIECRVLVTPLAVGEAVDGVILVMEERPPSEEPSDSR